MSDVAAFKPSYVWPNPAFPFRVYFDSPQCRIFIIENIQHNWSWMSRWHSSFRPTDYFFVIGGWYHSPEFAREADTIFRVLSLDKSRFFFLFNSPREQQNFAVHGFGGEVIPHNAWLDEDLVMRPLALPKAYRAIYVARRSAFKRHMLAAKVNGLALVAGINHGNAISDIPAHTYLNERPLSPEEVCVKINESHCGLLLSALEGGCFSSSEYLLCGVPVVSTPSLGGRDVWYDEHNSIVCDPTPEAVAEAVEHFVARAPDPHTIRERHIALARQFRGRFVEALGAMLRDCGVDNLDPREYFDAHFFHKMRKSYRPDFELIFG